MSSPQINPAILGKRLKTIKTAEQKRTAELDSQIQELEKKLYVEKSSSTQTKKPRATPRKKRERVEGRSNVRKVSQRKKTTTENSESTVRSPQKVKRKKIDSDVKTIKTPVKKDFVLEPRLTHRPLVDSEALKALRDSIPQNKNQNHKGGRPPKIKSESQQG